MSKYRLSATVEGELVSAGRRAVAEGRARSVSDWVNDALRDRAEHDRQLKALDEYIRAYEAEHGVITDQDIENARRHYAARTVRVRPRAARPRPRRGAGRRSA